MPTKIASAKKLIINKLTQAQYDSIPEKDPAQLYLITDAEVSGDTSGFTREEADGLYVSKDESGAAMFDVISRTQGQIEVPNKSGTIALLSDLENYTAGEGVIIPSQENNAGKFLTTDGNNLSWAEVTASNTNIQVTEMPEATEENFGMIVQYVGESTEQYVKGFFYENSICYNTSIEHEIANPSGYRDIDVVLDIGVFSEVVNNIPGTYTFAEEGMEADRIALYNESGEVILAIETPEVEAFADFGIVDFVYPNGQSAMGPGIVGIKVNITLGKSIGHMWSRVDIQPVFDPIPSQEGNAGKILSTDGSAVMWVDAPSYSDNGGSSGVVFDLIAHKPDGEGDFGGIRYKLPNNLPIGEYEFFFKTYGMPEATGGSNVFFSEKNFKIRLFKESDIGYSAIVVPLEGSFISGNRSPDRVSCGQIIRTKSGDVYFAIGDSYEMACEFAVYPNSNDAIFEKPWFSVSKLKNVHTGNEYSFESQTHISAWDITYGLLDNIVSMTEVVRPAVVYIPEKLDYYYGNAGTALAGEYMKFGCADTKPNNVFYVKIYDSENPDNQVLGLEIDLTSKTYQIISGEDFFDLSLLEVVSSDSEIDSFAIKLPSDFESLMLMVSSKYMGMHDISFYGLMQYSDIYVTPVKFKRVSNASGGLTQEQADALYIKKSANGGVELDSTTLVDRAGDFKIHSTGNESTGIHITGWGAIYPENTHSEYTTLGRAEKKWPKAYISTLNNGEDIQVPNKAGTLALLSDLEGLSGGASGFTKEEADWYYIQRDESGAAMFDMISRTQGQITVPDKPGTLALLSDLEGLSGGEGCLTQEQADLLYVQKTEAGDVSLNDQSNLSADDSSNYAATTAWVQKAIDSKLSGIESILDELNGETLEG